MKVMVVGSGGREHCLAWKISHSGLVDKIYCAPGNGGMSEIGECVSWESLVDLASFAQEEKSTSLSWGRKPLYLRYCRFI